jgi:hypothetical protein
MEQVKDDFFLYDANEVMQLIGKQYIVRHLDANFYEVMAAHKAAPDCDNELMDIAIDFYMLGIIKGKRVERERKSRAHNLPVKKKA